MKFPLNKNRNRKVPKTDKYVRRQRERAKLLKSNSFRAHKDDSLTLYFVSRRMFHLSYDLYLHRDDLSAFLRWKTLQTKNKLNWSEVAIVFIPLAVGFQCQRLRFIRRISKRNREQESEKKKHLHVKVSNPQLWLSEGKLYEWRAKWMTNESGILRFEESRALRFLNSKAL